MIKAIETVYNGYRFRSRLEARWAVFFDCMGVEYKYEPEGFELDESDRVRYLPDFFVPCWNKYIEIKPGGNAENHADILKIAYLCQKGQIGTMLLVGDPWPGRYTVIPFIPMYSTEERKIVVGMPWASSENGTTIRHWFYFGQGLESNRLYLVQRDEPGSFDGIVKMPADILPCCCDWAGEDGGMFWALTPERMDVLPLPGMEQVYAIIGSVSTLAGHGTPLAEAYIQATQARFEHGEQPEIVRIS